MDVKREHIQELLPLGVPEPMPTALAPKQKKLDLLENDNHEGGARARRPVDT
jgi:hypothetical protein